MNRAPFGVDEWYHCYSRGIDRRATFVRRTDYERFLGLLHICNDMAIRHRSDRGVTSLSDILQRERNRPLTAIGAFCLMPNHFHLLLRETQEGGISTFMQKLGTSYAMYFNIRHRRIGNVFVKPFRSQHIDEDRYLQHVIQYIHCNPAELFEPGWKRGHVRNIETLRKDLLDYRYSSFAAFNDDKSVLRKILDDSIFEIAAQPEPQEMLQGALEYYRDVKVTP